MKKLYKIGYWSLFIFMVLIALMLLFSLFPIKGNFQIKVVQSGSMEPKIHTGSIVVIKPESSYTIGDIITFGEDTKKTTPTTHRILNSRVIQGKIYFTTKGDANEDPDVIEVTEDKIIGKVLFNLPYLGYVINLAKKPLGFMIIIGVPTIMIVYDEIQKIILEMKRLRVKKLAKNETQEEKNNK